MQRPSGREESGILKRLRDSQVAGAQMPSRWGDSKALKAVKGLGSELGGGIWWTIKL